MHSPSPRVATRGLGSKKNSPPKRWAQIFQAAAKGFFLRSIRILAFQPLAVDGLLDNAAVLAGNWDGSQQVLRLPIQ
jgi:hypothetical protein